MSKIIELPVYKDLKEEIKKDKLEISEKVIERDNLLYHVCKNIENEYIYKFGDLEYRAYELEVKYRRLRKKLEILIYNRNHGIKIKDSEIEKSLDQMFREYKIELENMMDNINNALEFHSAKSLTEDEKNQLKSLYRKIVKKLHPDLNQNLTDAKLELFYNAVKAYKNGDLKTIQFIFSIIELDGEVKKEDSLKELRLEKDHLKHILSDIEKMIDSIKLDYPYILSIYLRDEEKAAKKIEDLEEQINTYKDYILRYEKEVKKYSEIVL